MATATPSIYIASLADYNAGRLIGDWIELTDDLTASDVHDTISGILAQSPEPIAEEWAIHDYDNFHGLHIGEYESIDYVLHLAHALTEHGPAVAAYLDWLGTDNADGFDDAYRGEWESEREYAYEYLDSTGDWDSIPQWAQQYFDIDAYTDALFIDECYSAPAPNGNIYVFDRNA